jgi:preprotein translocase subunit SecA
MRHETIADMVERAIPEGSMSEQWDAGGLTNDVRRLLALDLPIADWMKEEGIDEEAIRERLETAADTAIAQKAANFGALTLRMVEKSLLLQILDHVWKEHLLALDHLRQGIGLRAYGQRDPLNEYKSEAFALFQRMLVDMRERVTSVMAGLDLSPPPREPELEGAMAGGAAMAESPRLPPARTAPANGVDPADPATWNRTPRNAACPCGSGKKYKHCHGRG